MFFLSLSIHLRAPCTSHSTTTGIPALEKRMRKEREVFQRMMMFPKMSTLKSCLKLPLNCTLYEKTINSIQKHQLSFTYAVYLGPGNILQNV